MDWWRIGGAICPLGWFRGVVQSLMGWSSDCSMYDDVGSEVRMCVTGDKDQWSWKASDAIVW